MTSCTDRPNPPTWQLPPANPPVSQNASWPHSFGTACRRNHSATGRAHRRAQAALPLHILQSGAPTMLRLPKSSCVSTHGLAAFPVAAAAQLLHCLLAAELMQPPCDTHSSSSPKTQGSLPAACTALQLELLSCMQ